MYSTAGTMDDDTGGCVRANTHNRKTPAAVAPAVLGIAVGVPPAVGLLLKLLVEQEHHGST